MMEAGLRPVASMLDVNECSLDFIHQSPTDRIDEYDRMCGAVAQEVEELEE